MKPIALLLAGLVVSGTPLDAATPHPRFGFPVYTNQPAGKQLSGQHKPADTPALSPAEAQSRFTLPPGYEIRLFASEPEIANPVAMTWDARGRLWVLELYEYPLGAPEGQPGRDRVKILEDSDADGRVDSVKVFADGLNLATGLLLANDGVYVGQAPHLLFLQDTDGDDVADRRTVVQTGFGLEDRHELLNGFTWGPDGQIYMTHGVFTHTRASDPDNPASEPVVLTAGVARFDPRRRRLEVFAEGTSNPWGVDFDARGNAFVSACVIDHFFHLAPGGLYQRQAGRPPYPYAYELLPSIVDHRHHMAAYAGVDIYTGNQFPEEMQGMALMGNIHDNAIHQDRLEPAGSTFKASFVRDFVRANDGWFMPVSTQTGPDGAVWIMDWYDRYPCYQNANADPNGVDRERGRIWRVVHVGDTPGRAVPSRPAPDMDLAALGTPELIALLKHPNDWQRRMAQRILSGRNPRDLRAPLLSLLLDGPSPEARLAALWTLHSAGLTDNEILDEASDSAVPAVRMWSARLTGERNQPGEETMRRLARLATDETAMVQAAVATAVRQFTSGSLTVNTPARQDPSVAGPLALGVLGRLIPAAHDTTDRDLPFLIWTALEPLLLFDPNQTWNWLAEQGAANMPLAGRIAYKATRRFADARVDWMLNGTLELIERLPSDSPLLVPILDGLIEGARANAVLPTKPSAPVLDSLLANPVRDVADRAARLGTLWGNASALKAALETARNPSAPDSDRIAAIQAARQGGNDESRNTLLDVTRATGPEPVRIAAVRALAEAGNDGTGATLLGGWDAFPPAVRRAVAELCTTRWQWRGPLLDAVERGNVLRGDLPPTVLRALVTSKDDSERARATRIFGRFQATAPEKARLIEEKRAVVVRGPVDLDAGREIAARTCLICHRLHGTGAAVGPDLTGVGRSSLDALLHNVINPNEIIGQGYENVVVETDDGRTVAGRLLEDGPNGVRLLQSGGAEEVIPRARVKSVSVTDNSVMPEGLEQMPDADFRNLIWFLLAPPEDGRPLTEELRRQLGGDPGTSASTRPAVQDGESLALWSPGWQVEAPETAGTPARHPEWGGRRNVLQTHPHDGGTPAAIVRSLVLPPEGNLWLRFEVAAHPDADWDLRVLADGELLFHRTVASDAGNPWQEVALDLGRFAGRRIVLRLENRADDWRNDFGYWTAIRLAPGPDTAAR